MSNVTNLPPPPRGSTPSIPISSPPTSGNGGGNGNDLHGRVSALEAHFQHLATKNDITNLKVWILGGVLGGISLAVGAVKVFF